MWTDLKAEADAYVATLNVDGTEWRTTDGRIGHGWRSYRHHVVPDYANAVQLEELRRAYYGGAISVFGLLSSKRANARMYDLINAEVARIGRELDNRFGISEDMAAVLLKLTGLDDA